jgi:hypothetical protein
VGKFFKRLLSGRRPANTAPKGYNGELRKAFQDAMQLLVDPQIVPLGSRISVDYIF